MSLDTFANILLIVSVLGYILTVGVVLGLYYTWKHRRNVK
jgi:hypothetical protein